MQRRGLIPKSPVRTIIRSSLRWVSEQKGQRVVRNHRQSGEFFDQYRMRAGIATGQGQERQNGPLPMPHPPAVHICKESLGVHSAGDGRWQRSSRQPWQSKAGCPCQQKLRRNIIGLDTQRRRSICCWSTTSPAFGGCGGSGAEVGQGELAEEEVHGDVEVNVSANSQQQQQVS